MKFSRIIVIVVASILCLQVAKAQYWEWNFVPSYQGGNNGPVGVFDHDIDGDLDIWLIYGPLLGSINRLPDEWGEVVVTIEDAGFVQDGTWLDFDADGDMDLAFYATLINSGRIGWIENINCPQFDVHLIEEFATGGQYHTMSAGDIEADGDIDIVVTTTLNGSLGLSVWYQQPGQIWEAAQLSTNEHWNISRLVDLNDDARLDFIVWELNQGLTLYLSQPDGSFTPDLLKPNFFTVTGDPKFVDFDHDGDLDFVVSHNALQEGDPSDYPGAISWWENDGQANFTEHVADESDDPVFGIVIEPIDSNNDGFTDIAYYNSIYINSGDNINFEPIDYAEYPLFIDQLIAADIDNDGDMDLVSEEVRWFENPHIDLAVDDGYGEANIPSSFALHAAYPNPFNSATTITIALPAPSNLNVIVYNIIGHEVASLLDGPLLAGEHHLTWDTGSLSSGVYFIHATVLGHLDQVQKVMLVR